MGPQPHKQFGSLVPKVGIPKSEQKLLQNGMYSANVHASFIINKKNKLNK